MNVTIIGTGYVGLVSGTCLAEVGNHVLCIDNNGSKIEDLNRGELPIYEPGLENLVKENLSAKRLSFSTDLGHGVDFSEVLFIAVGTPPGEDGSADLSHVLAVASQIGQYMESYKVIVTKSTVPVGTSDKVRDTIRKTLDDRQLSVDFDVVSNPEFLKEGAAVEDFLKPDRIIVGVDSDRSYEIMHGLYQPFNRNHERVIRMDIRSSELTKYAANAMLATKISFMNEIANLAEKLGADIESVRQGIGSDPRIGYHFIYPGCGYGGSCFPKDVKALNRTARQHDYDARILTAVEAVNNDQKYVPVNKLIQHFGEDFNGMCFAVWGLSFKPNTDDMREAPSRVIMAEIWRRGGHVKAFDPVAREEAKKLYQDNTAFELVDQPYDALENADALIIVTEWKIFRSIDLDLVKQKMRQHVIVDGRNIYQPELLTQAGFNYYGIGR